jgi:hypothetical protein
MGVLKEPSFTREILENSEFKNLKLKGCLWFWPHSRTLKQYELGCHSKSLTFLEMGCHLDIVAI